MSKGFYAVLAVVCILFAGASCRSSKKATRIKLVVDSTAVTKNADTSGNAPEQISDEKRQLITALTPLWNKMVVFQTMTGKAKCHYEGMGNKQDFTANFRIQKDSVIWVSVTALGGIVQVARIYVTPDSFKMVNYLENSYTLMPLSQAGKILPVSVDFSILQNLVIGNVLQPGALLTDATDFGGSFSVQAENDQVIQQATYNKIDSTLRSLQMRTTSSADGQNGIVQYGNYEVRDNRKFSMSRAVNVVSNGAQYYLDMNFNNVDFDKHVDFPFSIPRNYERK